MIEISQIAPESGLYRCAICGAEVRVWVGEPLPACLGKDHSPRWIFDEQALMIAGASR
jgi:hypothetical protein